MLNVILSIVLALFAVMLLTERYKKWLDRNQHFAEFVVAIVATAFGVFLGMHAVRLEAERSERKAVVSLVQKARTSVDETIQTIFFVYRLSQEGGSDSMSVAKALWLTPLRSSPTIDALLGSELAMRHLSSEGFAQLLVSQGQIQGLSQAINGRSASNRKQAANLDALGTAASSQKHWLDGELGLLAGTMNEEQRHKYGSQWLMMEAQGVNAPGSWTSTKANPPLPGPVRSFHKDN